MTTTRQTSPTGEQRSTLRDIRRVGLIDPDLQLRISLAGPQLDVASNAKELRKAGKYARWAMTKLDRLERGGKLSEAGEEAAHRTFREICEARQRATDRLGISVNISPTPTFKQRIRNGFWRPLNKQLGGPGVGFIVIGAITGPVIAVGVATGNSFLIERGCQGLGCGGGVGLFQLAFYRATMHSWDPWFSSPFY